MSKQWIKTGAEQELMRQGGRLLAEILRSVIMAVQPGVTTRMLGDLAEEKIRAIGGDPIFKGYGKQWGAPPFPAALCVSLNDEVVHGIPQENRVIQSGDMVKLDIGMRYQGMVTDMARTVLVGTVSDEANRLQRVVKEALEAGIATLRPGSRMNEYAEAVEAVVLQAGFQCVKDLVGHGVGNELHEDPQIANYAGSGLPNFSFEAGMVVALEPMINAGTYKVRLARDGWAFLTADGRLSAHYENTVLISENGAEILTTLESW